jgi:argininosuccinate synthase
VEPPADAYQRTVAPELAPDAPEYVAIEFVEGVPVALNGKVMDSVSLVMRLNEIGGSHGVGRLDLVENRLVGIKSREIYEAPAATILHFAHTELERLTLDKQVFHMKNQLAAEYANLVYNGLWFTPLKEALDAFVNETQKAVTGNVTVKLYKGTTAVTARSSQYSLYNVNLATYTSQDTFNHKASEGFITIYGLPVKTYNQVHQKKGAETLRQPSSVGEPAR